MPNPKLISAIVLLLMLAFLTTQMLSYRALYHTEKADFALYKTTREANDKIAAAKNKQTEENWNKLFSETEVRHAHDLETTHARFAAELVRLRQRTTTANHPLPDTPISVSVCADASDNQRLSDALSSYREEERRGQIDTLQLLEICQSQTDTLIGCQSDLRTLMQ